MDTVFVVVVGDLEFSFSASKTMLEDKGKQYGVIWSFIKFNTINPNFPTPHLNLSDHSKIDAVIPIVLSILKDYNQPYYPVPTLEIEFLGQSFNFDKMGRLL